MNSNLYGFWYLSRKSNLARKSSFLYSLVKFTVGVELTASRRRNRGGSKLHLLRWLQLDKPGKLLPINSKYTVACKNVKTMRVIDGEKTYCSPFWRVSLAVSASSSWQWDPQRTCPSWCNSPLAAANVSNRRYIMLLSKEKKRGDDAPFWVRVSVWVRGPCLQGWAPTSNLSKWANRRPAWTRPVYWRFGERNELFDVVEYIQCIVLK